MGDVVGLEAGKALPAGSFQPAEGVLTDRKAKKFPVRCGGGVRTIYNPVPLYMADKPGALPVDYGVAYFTLESREEAAAVLGRITRGEPFDGDFTRGLYYKGTN